MTPYEFDSKLVPLLREKIDANWRSQVEFLSRLVRLESTRGNEAACQDALEESFATRGWLVDRFPISDVAIADLPGYSPAPAQFLQSSQLVATLPHVPIAGARSLIFQGHVDVVPPGPRALWERDPFSGEFDGDWLWGRGAQDMKAGIAAMIFALDAIRDAGLVPGAPIYVQCVTEEESTGNGALAALARGYRAQACIIPEPTSHTITRAQCGAVWFRLKVQGRPVHVARSEAGSNAILSAMGLVAALQQLASVMNQRARESRWFSAVPEPIKFNPGVIAGGDWPSSTPAWCEVQCRLGLLPEDSLAEVRARVENAVASAAQQDAFLGQHPPLVIWEGFQADGSFLAPGSDAETLLAAAHRLVVGTAMEERLSNAVNDTRFYNRYYDIPALCYGPAGKGMHGFNERVSLSSLRDTTLIFALFIAAWCKTKKA